MRNVVRALKHPLDRPRWPCRWPPCSWGLLLSRSSRTDCACCPPRRRRPPHKIEYGFAEESLPAFDWAVKNGADIIDFDAQVTQTTSWS